MKFRRTISHWIPPPPPSPAPLCHKSLLSRPLSSQIVSRTLSPPISYLIDSHSLKKAGVGEWGETRPERRAIRAEQSSSHLTSLGQQRPWRAGREVPRRAAPDGEWRPGAAAWWRRGQSERERLGHTLHGGTAGGQSRAGPGQGTGK